MTESFHFLRPWWLLALVPWLLLAWQFWRRDPDRGAWRKVCDEALLPFVIEAGSPARRRAAALLLSLAGTLGILALAGPAWRELPQPVFRGEEALVVVLDLSRSMDATDLKPSRLARARLKVRDLIRMRTDGQTALVVFAGDAFTVTPLTDDVNTIDALVLSLSTKMMPVLGTRTDRALDKATSLLAQAGVQHGQVVLFTDNAGSPGLNSAVARLTQQGYRLSIIGVGTPEGAPIRAGKGRFVKDAAGKVIIPTLPEAELRALARVGNGRYVRLRVDDQDLEHVLASPGAKWSSVTDVPGLTSDRWREEGPWLVLLLLPLASLVFRRGVLMVTIGLILAPPEAVFALDWRAPWLTDNQRGARLFQAEKYGLAAAEFSSVEWKAAALYRAGRYEESAELLATLGHPEALYNRGNALARTGALDQAKALYQQVLQTDPAHTDARHNLELLMKLEPPSEPQSQGGGREEKPDGSPEASDDNPPGGGGDESGGEPPPDGAEAPEDGGQGGKPPDPDSSGQASNLPPSGQENSGEPPSPDGEKSDAEVDEAEERRESTVDDLSESADESEQAMKQWLRRIPDDPGGLLRRKFQHQYSRRPPRGDGRGDPW